MSYRILVADDEKDIVASLQKCLLREGYLVSVAFDGEEALLRVKEDNPDIVLLDLMMPKRNGFEVLQAIRKDFKDKWRPVIIISGQADLDSVKKGYALEADHYLTKPVTMEVILHGVQTMISLIPLRRDNE